MKLKSTSSKNLIKFLTTKGFILHHKKGSHIIMYKIDFGRVVIPERKELPIGTLKAILRVANISREEYFHFFKK